MATEASAPRRKLSAILIAALTFWRSETPWWWLLLGGVVVLAVGVTKLRTAVVPRSIR